MDKRLLIIFLYTFRCFAPTGDSYSLASGLIAGYDNQRKTHIGVFQDLMVAQRYDSINVMFQYNIPGDLVLSSVENGGSITHDGATGAMAKISTSVNPSGCAKLTSKNALRYVSGHDAYTYFTAAFTRGVHRSIQWAGIFDSVDGFAVGYKGANFSLLYRLNSTDYIVDQSDFNIDKLDGSGPSKIKIDPTKINIYKISFGWLGTAPIYFEICRSDGTWFTFHKIQRANTVSVPSVYNPVLPITMEVANYGNDSNITIKTASWSAGILGAHTATRQHQRSRKRFIFDDGTGGASWGAKLAIAIRNESSFEGKSNKINVYLVRTYLSATSSTPFLYNAKSVTFSFYKGNAGMVRDGTWNFHDDSASNKTSCVKYNVTATSLSGGKEVFMVPFVARESKEIIFDKKNDGGSTVISLNPGEELAIEASTNDSTDVVGGISIVWHETIN